MTVTSTLARPLRVLRRSRASGFLLGVACIASLSGSGFLQLAVILRSQATIVTIRLRALSDAVFDRQVHGFSETVDLYLTGKRRYQLRLAATDDQKGLPLISARPRRWHTRHPRNDNRKTMAHDVSGCVPRDVAPLSASLFLSLVIFDHSLWL